jgi:nicotinamide riboside transporter PnuC
MCWTWIITTASIVGVFLNIKKKVVCFYIWAATNATWAMVDAAHGIYSQSALQGVYFGLSIYGILSWSKKPRGGK